MMLVLNVAISASDNEGTVKAGGMPGRKIKFRYGMFFTGEYGMGMTIKKIIKQEYL